VFFLTCLQFLYLQWYSESWFFKLVSLSREMEEESARYNFPPIGLCQLVNLAYLYSLLSLSLIGHRHLVYNESWYLLKDRNKWNWPGIQQQNITPIIIFYFIHCASVYPFWNMISNSFHKYPLKSKKIKFETLNTRTSSFFSLYLHIYCISFKHSYLV